MALTQFCRDPPFWVLKWGCFKRFLNKIMLDGFAKQRELESAVGAGGSIIRKSFKIRHTKEIAHLFCISHTIASES